MKYDLTQPCAECPFRADKPFFLPRARDICEGLLEQDATFSCHKTVDYDKSYSGQETKNTQHCAGALIFLEQQEKPHQMMRIAERLGLYDHTKLSKKIPVYRSLEAMVLGCSGLAKRPKKRPFPKKRRDEN
jgi:hypothetical protein